MADAGQSTALECPECGARIDPKHTNPALCFTCGWTDAEPVQQARLRFNRPAADRQPTAPELDSKMAAAGEKEDDHGQ